MTDLQAVPGASSDADSLWPAHWTEEAIAAVETVLEAASAADSTFSGGPWAALMSVGEMLTTTAALEEIARAANYASTGSTGQPVLHWAVAEARQTRAVATATLARMRGAEDAERG